MGNDREKKVATGQWVCTPQRYSNYQNWITKARVTTAYISFSLDPKFLNLMKTVAIQGHNLCVPGSVKITQIYVVLDSFS